MLEVIIVALIVLVAAIYALWALAPGTSRRSAALRISVALGGPQATGLKGWVATRLHRLATAAAGGCGDCASNVQTPAERAGRKQGG